jgi:proteasome activator subunit 4
MAISNMVDFIRLGDISEIEEDDSIPAGSRALRSEERGKVADDPNDPAQSELEDLSPEEVNSRIRFATAAFRDWVPEFMERVLLLFANLPEEGGKSGRAGGKTEALTLQSVLVSFIFASPDLADTVHSILVEESSQP